MADPWLCFTDHTLRTMYLGVVGSVSVITGCNDFFAVAMRNWETGVIVQGTFYYFFFTFTFL